MASVLFFYDPVSKFDTLFGDALAARLPNRNRASCSSKRVEPKKWKVYCPRLDLDESEDTNTVVVTIELPGLASKDVTIDIENGRLTISGEWPCAAEKDEDRVVVRERHVGKFSRTLQLPRGTKAEDVKAKMENGVLTISFPRVPADRQSEHIVVQ